MSSTATSSSIAISNLAERSTAEVASNFTTDPRFADYIKRYASYMCDRSELNESARPSVDTIPSPYPSHSDGTNDSALLLFYPPRGSFVHKPISTQIPVELKGSRRLTAWGRVVPGDLSIPHLVLDDATVIFSGPATHISPASYSPWNQDFLQFDKVRLARHMDTSCPTRDCLTVQIPLHPSGGRQYQDSHSTNFYATPMGPAEVVKGHHNGVECDYAIQSWNLGMEVTRSDTAGSDEGP